MRTLKTIIVTYLATGCAVSLPSRNANSFELMTSTDSVSNSLLRTRTTNPSQENIDNITRRLWEAKKLRVPGLSSKIKRELENEQDPEPKNDIRKGPNRSSPRSKNNLTGEDIKFLENYERAYQIALKKTRQGYDRDTMIAYIRDMLPILSEQAVKEIVDEAVEMIVAEDILNWKDQKASLEQMTYPKQPSIPEHVSLSPEEEWPMEMVHRMATLKAAEGKDNTSMTTLLQKMFPHIDESRIREIATEATENIKESPNHDSLEDPSGNDQPPSKKRKRETGSNNAFDALNKRISGRRYFRNDAGRRFTWETIYTMFDGSLDTAAISEQLDIVFAGFGISDANAMPFMAEQMKAGMEADIAALNAVAQFVQSNREGWSTTFQDLPISEQKRTGLLLSEALARSRENVMGLPELLASLREKFPKVERDIAELAARAAFFILDNADYSQELQAPRQDHSNLLRRRSQSDESMKSNHDSNEEDEEKAAEKEMKMKMKKKKEDEEHRLVVFLLESIESQIRERAEADVRDPESIARDIRLKYPFIDFGYLKQVANRVVVATTTAQGQES